MAVSTRSCPIEAVAQRNQVGCGMKAPFIKITPFNEIAVQPFCLFYYLICKYTRYSTFQRRGVKVLIYGYRSSNRSLFIFALLSSPNPSVTTDNIAVGMVFIVQHCRHGN